MKAGDKPKAEPLLTEACSQEARRQLKNRWGFWTKTHKRIFNR